MFFGELKKCRSCLGHLRKGIDHHLGFFILGGLNQLSQYESISSTSSQIARNIKTKQFIKPPPIRHYNQIWLVVLQHNIFIYIHFCHTVHLLTLARPRDCDDEIQHTKDLGFLGTTQRDLCFDSKKGWF